MSETNNTKQAAWVAFGSLFSFGFGIASSMILSRYFDKADYGTYKQVLYVYNSLLVLFTMGLPQAFSYFLPKSPLNEAKNLIKKLTNVFFLSGGIVSLLLFFCSGIIADFLGNPELTVALKMFAPVPFMMMPTMGLDGILATYKKTKFLAIYTITTRAIMLCCVALPVFLINGSYKMAIVGFNIGVLVTLILALFLKYYPVRKGGNEKTTYTYKTIFKYSFPLLAASIWGVLINSTDQFFISRYFGNETFAIFSNGAMDLPFVGMIISACSTVLIPLFTRKVHEKADFMTDIYPIWHSSFEKSAMLIYPLTIFCIFNAELIMTIMYGDKYAASSDFFRIKLLTYFVKIISYYAILLALGATKYYRNIFMYGFFLLVLAEWLSLQLFRNPLLITAIHTVFTISYCLTFIRYIAKRFSISFWKLIPKSPILKLLVNSVLSIAISQYIRLQFLPELSDILHFCFNFGCFATIYLLLSIPLKQNYLKIIIPLFK